MNTSMSIAGSKTPTLKRFAETSTEELNRSLENSVPQNTRNKSKWAMNIFRKWLSEWRVRIDDDTTKVLKDIEEFTKGDLDYCLQYFYSDLRKRSGDRYPPQTQKDVATGIQFYFNNMLNWNISLFNDNDFMKSRRCLNAQMKIAAQEGLVKPTRKAITIPQEAENDLWENGTFGWSTPKQLQDTLIYYFGLHFSLRAAQEHRNLIYGANSQITLNKDDLGCEYLQYVERMSKNKTFGLKTARMEPKSTVLYARADKLRCPVECYKRYISLRPEANGGKPCEAFYLGIGNSKNGPWYKSVPLGLHSIQNTTKDLFKSIDLKGFVSNTSLRRTAQTRLLQGGVQKEVIQKKTGRLSDSADSAYIDGKVFERKMSSVLYGEVSKTVNITCQPTSSSKDAQVPFSFSNCSNCTVTVNYNFK